MVLPGCRPDTVIITNIGQGQPIDRLLKEDVGAPVVAVGAYANTVRRRLVDIAGKIVSHGGNVVLKVTRACFENLGLSGLFDRCYRTPIIV
jgi:hypothetical protein